MTVFKGVRFYVGECTKFSRILDEKRWAGSPHVGALHFSVGETMHFRGASVVDALRTPSLNNSSRSFRSNRGLADPNRGPVRALFENFRESVLGQGWNEGREELQFFFWV